MFSRAVIFQAQSYSSTLMVLTQVHGNHATRLFSVYNGNWSLIEDDSEDLLLRLRFTSVECVEEYPRPEREAFDA